MQCTLDMFTFGSIHAPTLKKWGFFLKLDVCKLAKMSPMKLVVHKGEERRIHELCYERVRLGKAIPLTEL